MSKAQHAEAGRLLQLIIRAAKSKQQLTYAKSAGELGRDPKKNARMIAQICDLLDAAAAFARVPLLALIAVREASGDVNRGHGEQARRHTLSIVESVFYRCFQ